MKTLKEKLQERINYWKSLNQVGTIPVETVVAMLEDIRREVQIENGIMKG